MIEMLRNVILIVVIYSFLDLNASDVKIGLRQSYVSTYTVQRPKDWPIIFETLNDGCVKTNILKSESVYDFITNIYKNGFFVETNDRASLHILEHIFGAQEVLTENFYSTAYWLNMDYAVATNIENDKDQYAIGDTVITVSTTLKRIGGIYAYFNLRHEDYADKLRTSIGINPCDYESIDTVYIPLLYIDKIPKMSDVELVAKRLYFNKYTVVDSIGDECNFYSFSENATPISLSEESVPVKEQVYKYQFKTIELLNGLNYCYNNLFGCDFAFPQDIRLNTIEEVSQGTYPYITLIQNIGSKTVYICQSSVYGVFWISNTDCIYPVIIYNVTN